MAIPGATFPSGLVAGYDSSVLRPTSRLVLPGRCTLHMELLVDSTAQMVWAPHLEVQPSSLLPWGSPVGWFHTVLVGGPNDPRLVSTVHPSPYFLWAVTFCIRLPMVLLGSYPGLVLTVREGGLAPYTSWFVRLALGFWFAH